MVQQASNQVDERRFPRSALPYKRDRFIFWDLQVDITQNEGILGLIDILELIGFLELIGILWRVCLRWPLWAL